MPLPVSLADQLNFHVIFVITSLVQKWNWRHTIEVYTRHLLPLFQTWNWVLAFWLHIERTAGGRTAPTNLNFQFQQIWIFDFNKSEFSTCQSQMKTFSAAAVVIAANANWFHLLDLISALSASHAPAIALQLTTSHKCSNCHKHLITWLTTRIVTWTRFRWDLISGFCFPHVALFASSAIDHHHLSSHLLLAWVLKYL